MLKEKKYTTNTQALQIQSGFQSWQNIRNISQKQIIKLLMLTIIITNIYILHNIKHIVRDFEKQYVFLKYKF